MIPFNYNIIGVERNMAKDEIVDYGSTETGWYRKWKSGFIEQGGITTNANVTFPIPMNNANYSF